MMTLLMPRRTRKELKVREGGGRGGKELENKRKEYGRERGREREREEGRGEERGRDKGRGGEERSRLLTVSEK